MLSAEACNPLSNADLAASATYYGFAVRYSLIPLFIFYIINDALPVRAAAAMFERLVI